MISSTKRRVFMTASCWGRPISFPPKEVERMKSSVPSLWPTTASRLRIFDRFSNHRIHSLLVRTPGQQDGMPFYRRGCIQQGERAALLWQERFQIPVRYRRIGKRSKPYPCRRPSGVKNDVSRFVGLYTIIPPTFHY